MSSEGSVLKNRKTNNNIQESKSLVKEDENETRESDGSRSTVAPEPVEKTKKLKKSSSPSFFWSLLDKNTFMILLAIRSLSVLFNLVWDCDETYNYWEPLHFLLYGNGFQTWEYSPTYALRSYLYLLIHLLPLYVFKYFVSKITVFYILRFLFAVVCSKAESNLYRSLVTITSTHKNYQYVARYYLLLTLSNAGMFLSSTSFLPSTFCMYMTMFAYASWIENPKSRSAIFFIGTSILLGWPFALILGVPLVIDICFLSIDKSDLLKSFISNLSYFLKWTIIFGILIAVPLVSIDSYFFGKLVIAPLNIFMYNVFPSNPNIGPDIYGREPLSYYLLNCLLNFNLLFPITFFSLILLGFDYFLIRTNKSNSLPVAPEKEKETQQRVNLDYLNDDVYKINKCFRLVTFGLYLWMLVFFTRPHKEERFLYPVYPLLLVVVSVSLNLVHVFVERYIRWSFLRVLFNQMPRLIIALHLVLSVMRVLALIFNFSSSLQIYYLINRQDIKFSSPSLESKELINVCVSKEWYRFPSSFFIPESINSNVKRQQWQLRFLESDFKGQLPGKFNETLTFPSNTRHVDKLFNDENKEVRQRYIHITKCDFLVDTDSISDDSNKQLFFNKKNTKTKWKTLIKLPFLNSTKSNKFLRSFYVPYLYEKRIKFTYFKLRVKISA